MEVIVNSEYSRIVKIKDRLYQLQKDSDFPMADTEFSNIFFELSEGLYQHICDNIGLAAYYKDNDFMKF